ncbi:hypothetical protein PENSTE_c011G08210 [Penicillium steckii]|uniref:Uncharacterized protein n=1 Tax=Penicillium steckii TaxID=303698 RepID=A0A1V6T6G6_9EURO|nr:hypothetical protein PENSTE_c011G08210 [Penicillium steckii]
MLNEDCNFYVRIALDGGIHGFPDIPMLRTDLLVSSTLIQVMRRSFFASPKRREFESLAVLPYNGQKGVMENKIVVTLRVATILPFRFQHSVGETGAPTYTVTTRAAAILPIRVECSVESRLTPVREPTFRPSSSSSPALPGLKSHENSGTQHLRNPMPTRRENGIFTQCVTTPGWSDVGHCANCHSDGKEEAQSGDYYPSCPPALSGVTRTPTNTITPRPAAILPVRAECSVEVASYTTFRKAREGRGLLSQLRCRLNASQNSVHGLNNVESSNNVEY